MNRNPYLKVGHLSIENPGQLSVEINTAVLAVTAVDARRCIYRAAQRGPYLDLAAPGVDLLAATSIHDERGKSGTSYAVPFVSAAEAAVLSQSPDLVASDLRTQLKAAASDLGAEGEDEVLGAGLLSASDLCGTGEDRGEAE